MNEIHEVSAADIERAAERLRSITVKTPVLTCESLDKLTGARLFFKCENLQTGGAFKFRGASNAVLGLCEQGPVPGVATHSSGNHGLALALAARRMGLSADVVAPKSAVASKLKAMKAAGATLHLCEPTQKAREAGLASLVECGLIPIPPYDHPLVIAGQGTATRELCEEIEELDALIAPIGGGGLLAGSALAAKHHNPSIRLFGAEPSGADDCWQSLEKGQRIEDFQPNTVADGLRALIGEITFPIIQHHCERVIRVSEPEILAAMRHLWELMNLIIEPSSATVLAAIMKQPETFQGLKTGVILSGGNLDLDAIPFLNQT